MPSWTLKVGNRWLCVNLYQLIGVSVIVGAIISFSISTAFLSINSNINAGKFLIEKKKEIEISMALKSLKGKIDSINMKLESVIDLDNKERLVWGLPSINEDIRKLGVGGREVNIRNSPGGIIREAIQDLRRKLDFETTSFGEIYNQIERKKKIFLHTPSIWPTYGTITSGFGWRRLSGEEFHKGVDIANSPGTPVMVTADGVVNYVGYSEGLGLIVEIDHGFGYKTRYGHLSRASVKLGESIKRGQVIGAIGTSGRVTGPHLHYEVIVLAKELDPTIYIIPGTATY